MKPDKTNSNIQSKAKPLKSKVLTIFIWISLEILAAGVILFLITSSVFALMLPVIIAVVALLAGHALAGNIDKGLKSLESDIDAIASGNLSLRSRVNETDELSMLSNKLAAAVETLHVIKTDNDKSDSNVDIYDIAKYLDSYAKGNLDIEIRKFTEQSVNEAFDELKRSIINIFDDINKLSEFTLSSKLDMRINVSKHKGIWAELATDINSLVEQFGLSIQEFKNSLESCTNLNNKYMSEAIRVLNELGNKNFDVEIKEDFTGDYAEIKTAINSIVTTFNELLSEISGSADSIYEDANYIAGSSIALKEGASKQGAEIDELLKNLADIGKHAKENSKTAAAANELTQKTQEKAALGEVELKEMQKAISDINEATSNISKVIKVIDDIAFQTNLLALNAAVEAARAGQHGKGFAVVAEEVRSLANRSQNAAKETETLIEGSVEKATEGTKIANKTASTLHEIIEQVSEISTLINGVATSSEGQESAVEQISTGVQKISAIAESNSTTSEATVSSAETLNSQTKSFKHMMSSFKIKRGLRKESSLLKKLEPASEEPKVNKTEIKAPKTVAAAIKPTVKTMKTEAPKKDAVKPLTAQPPKKVSATSAQLPKKTVEAVMPPVLKDKQTSNKSPHSQSSHEDLLKEIHATPFVAGIDDSEQKKSTPAVPKPIAPPPKLSNNNDNSDDIVVRKGPKAKAPDFGHVYNKSDFGKF